MSTANVFVVNLQRDEDAPVVERMLVPVGTIVWPFAQRVWRQIRGEVEMPVEVKPLMLLQPDQSGTLQEAPPGDLTPAGRWSFSPRKDPLYPIVELTLDTKDEILSHGFYRLGDAFDRPLANLAEILATRGESLGDPGHFFYDVLVVPVASRRGRMRGLGARSEAFSEGSFELPMVRDGDPLLEFERLEDLPLGPVLQARPLFLVPGSHRIGETRFSADAWEDLALTLPMSLDREIGGYLVGCVGQGENGDETVTVQHAVPAELSAGDAHTLLMSPESGADIRQRIQKEWPGEELVGWYHTHVFPAENDVLSGLSAIDEKTHDEQFTRSWQLAVLVNVWREGGTVSRQVRSYRRNGKGKLVEVDYSVVERGEIP